MKIEELRKLDATLPAGPWWIGYMDAETAEWCLMSGERGHAMEIMRGPKHLLRLIAAMRNALPALLDCCEHAVEGRTKFGHNMIDAAEELIAALAAIE